MGSFNHPTINGISMLSVNNVKACDLLQECQDLFYEERSLEEAILGNHNLSQVSSRPEGRNTFIADMETMDHSELLNKYGISARPRDYLRLL